MLSIVEMVETGGGHGTYQGKRGGGGGAGYYGGGGGGGYDSNCTGGGGGGGSGIITGNWTNTVSQSGQTGQVEEGVLKTLVILITFLDMVEVVRMD